MTFDDITGDRKLWAVHFEGEDDNELYKVFNNWADTWFGYVLSSRRTLTT